MRVTWKLCTILIKNIGFYILSHLILHTFSYVCCCSLCEIDYSSGYPHFVDQHMLRYSPYIACSKFIWFGGSLPSWQHNSKELFYEFYYPMSFSDAHPKVSRLVGATSWTHLPRNYSRISPTTHPLCPGTATLQALPTTHLLHLGGIFYHPMSLPNANLNWCCLYVLISGTPDLVTMHHRTCPWSRSIFPGFTRLRDPSYPSGTLANPRGSIEF